MSLQHRLALSCVLLVACGRLRFDDLREAGTSDNPADDAQGVPERDADTATDGDVDANDTGDADALRDDAGAPTMDAQVDASGDAEPPDARACAPGQTGAGCDDCVRYVDRDSPAVSPDGLSWQTAMRDLVQGQVQAVRATQDPNGPSVCQLWVREGTYNIYVDNEVNTLPLAPEVQLYGGFAGSELQLSQRDIAAHPTILDGAEAGGGARRVYHVLASSAGGSIDGFIVQRGTAVGAQVPHGRGGGLLLSGGTLRMRNMIFRENSATTIGGAISMENATLIVESSTFEDNRADGSGGAVGALSGAAALTLRNVELRSNVAGGNGGALFGNVAMAIDFSNVLAVQNSAGGGGGALHLSNVRGTITASTFAANEAGSTASGIVLGCAAACTLQNSISWNPSSAPETALSGAFAVRHSLVRNGVAGVGTLSADPRFAASPTDLHLLGNSPAIDAADGCRGPEFDLDGRVRREVQSSPNTGIAPFSDMGAYEYQPGGSSYGPFSTLCP